jgi:lysozyme family protein
MIDLDKLKVANVARWTACHIKPEWLGILDTVSRRLIAAKARYEAVRTAAGIPWAVVAVIHQRECSQSWSGCLANGDPWNHETIHVPWGRGPFTSWELAAEDALENCAPHAAKWDDWSIGGALTLLEQYNGLGYAAGPFDRSTGHRYPPQASPYIWSGTDQYRSGKYIADGHYDANAVDHQTGCAALLKTMTALDPTIAQDWHP